MFIDLIINYSDKRNNPLMSEGAGGVDVPQALFYYEGRVEKNQIHVGNGFP